MLRKFPNRFAYIIDQNPYLLSHFAKYLQTQAKYHNRFAYIIDQNLHFWSHFEAYLKTKPKRSIFLVTF